MKKAISVPAVLMVTFAFLAGSHASFAQSIGSLANPWLNQADFRLSVDCHDGQLTSTSVHSGTIGGGYYQENPGSRQVLRVQDGALYLRVPSGWMVLGNLSHPKGLDDRPNAVCDNGEVTGILMPNIAFQKGDQDSGCKTVTVTNGHEQAQIQSYYADPAGQHVGDCQNGTRQAAVSTSTAARQLATNGVADEPRTYPCLTSTNR